MTCTWDAENRLTAVTPAAPAAGSLKAQFKYDYLGRRVEKSVSTWNTGTSSWDLTSCRRFVWAGTGTGGWLLLAELDGLDENAVVRTYTWGLDLAGLNGSIGSATAGADLESAGGIGGLLAVHDPGVGSGEDYAYLYDANGNVGQLVAWAEDYAGTADYAWDTGTPSLARLAAYYEYAPYGNLTASAGDYAAENPVRFSTNYSDDETGLIQGKYRYYDPAQGRWLGRDPIEEEGGVALFCYCLNGPVDEHDPLGQDMGKGQMAPKNSTGVRVTGLSGASAEELTAAAKEARRLAGLAKTAKERSQLLARARALQADAKTVQNARRYVNKFSRKGVATAELLCWSLGTYVPFLELDLTVTHTLNDAYATEALAYEAALDHWQQEGWNRGVDLRRQMSFTCCGDPYDRTPCRLQFYERMSLLYGYAYIRIESGKAADLELERLVGQVETATEGYLECLREACRHGLPRL